MNCGTLPEDTSSSISELETQLSVESKVSDVATSFSIISEEICD